MCWDVVGNVVVLGDVVLWGVYIVFSDVVETVVDKVNIVGFGVVVGSGVKATPNSLNLTFYLFV